ncbi:MAG: hypothetical protein WAT66_13170 [Actinomycetota bacterium]
MRRFFKTWTVGFFAGLALLSGVAAGVSVGPLRHEARSKLPALTSEPVLPAVSAAGSPGSLTKPAQVPGLVGKKVTLKLPGRLPAGTFLVGANATSFDPAPQLYDGTWQTEGCTEIDEGNLDQTHLLPGDGHGWPLASKDCIYLGGFGIGPARAAHSVDNGGVWVRSIAISNGVKTVVWQIIDATGYFYVYNPMDCDGCGIYDVKQRISADTGIPADNISVGATHSHAGPDLYGGWGGIPKWYSAQIRDSIIVSAKQALLNLRRAKIVVGEAPLRGFNNERRDTYYSAPDSQATWLLAKETPSNKVIATLANYAAHPTIVGGPVLHADWPGAASRRFQSRLGGVGLLFEGGLGNMSVRGRAGKDEDEQAENTGIAFGDAIIGDIRQGGITLTTNDVESVVTQVSHPVTNPALFGGGILNLFSRDFLPNGPGGDIPGAYHWSKAGMDDPGFIRGCDSAQAVQVKTPVVGNRIGNALVLFAPGEIFSNIALVAKSKTASSALTFVFGQSNDSLGYIIQSFEYDLQGNVATEYGTMTGEYEEVFAIDRCFGDHVLQTMLDIGRTLGF